MSNSSGKVRNFLVNSPSIIISKGKQDYSTFTSKLSRSGQETDPKENEGKMSSTQISKVKSFLFLMPSAMKMRTLQAYNELKENSNLMNLSQPAFVESYSEYIPEEESSTQGFNEKEEGIENSGLGDYFEALYAKSYNAMLERESKRNPSNFTQVDARREFQDYANNYIQELISEIQGNSQIKESKISMVSSFLIKSPSLIAEQSQNNSNSFVSKLKSQVISESHKIQIQAPSQKFPSDSINESESNSKSKNKISPSPELKYKTSLYMAFENEEIEKSASILEEESPKEDEEAFITESNKDKQNDKFITKIDSPFPLNNHNENQKNEAEAIGQHKDTTLNLDSSQISDNLNNPRNLPPVIRVPKSKLNDDSSFLNKSHISGISGNNDKEFSRWLTKQPKLKNMQKLFDITKEKEALQHRMRAMEEQIELLREVVHQPNPNQSINSKSNLQSKRNRFEIFYDINAHEKASSLVRKFNAERKRREEEKYKKFEAIYAEMRESVGGVREERKDYLIRLKDDRKERVKQRIHEHKQRQEAFKANQRTNKEFVKEIYKSPCYFKYSPILHNNDSPFLEKELAVMREREEKDEMIKRRDILGIQDTTNVQIQNDSYRNIVFVKRDVPEYIKEARAKVLLYPERAKQMKNYEEELRAWRVKHNIFATKPNILFSK